jgi:hypothetical protein
MRPAPISAQTGPFSVMNPGTDLATWKRLDEALQQTAMADGFSITQLTIPSKMAEKAASGQYS